MSAESDRGTEFGFEELRPSAGDRHAVGDGTTVGREGCDVILADVEVSRRHAVFRVSGPELAIEDLGSSNGTFVNERRVEAPTALALGDAVRFGDTVWRLAETPAPGTAIREHPSGRSRAPAPAPSRSTAPPFESVAHAPRRRSAGRSEVATRIAFAIVLATAIALAVYFAARDQPADAAGPAGGAIPGAAARVTD